MTLITRPLRRPSPPADGPPARRRSVAAAAFAIVSLLAFFSAVEPAHAAPIPGPASADGPVALASIGGQLQASGSKAQTTLSPAGVAVADTGGAGTATITPAGLGPLAPWQAGPNGTATTSRDGVAYQAVASTSGAAVIATAATPKDALALGFDLALPPGDVLQPTDDGGLDIVDGGGLTVGRIAAPWAKDAAGASLTTRYRLVGSRLAQDVDVTATTAYPILADPQLTWGYVTGTLYFNIPETQKIKSAGFLSAACAPFALVAQPAGAILASWCALNWGYLVYLAGQADSHSQCLDVKFGLGYANPTAGTYSGGYCTK